MILNMTGGSGGVQVVEFTVTENYVFDSISSNNYYVIPNVDIPAGGVKGFLIEPIGGYVFLKNYVLMIASQRIRDTPVTSEDLWYIYYNSDTTLGSYACNYAYGGFKYDPEAREVKLKCKAGAILQAARYRMILW